MTTQIITVQAVSKFGVRVGKGWLNADDPSILPQFQKGVTYSVEVGENGKIKAILPPTCASSVVDISPKRDYEPVDRQDSIVRQAAAKSASEVLSRNISSYVVSQEKFVETFTELFNPLFDVIHKAMKGV